MDDLAEHARVVHAGAPPREEHRAEGEPEDAHDRNTTAGEVKRPDEGFVPVVDKGKQPHPSTRGTAAGGTTRPGSPPVEE